MSEAPLYSLSHAVDYDGFVASNSRGLRDQVYASDERVAQGYLAHKKTLAPLGPP